MQPEQVLDPLQADHRLLVTVEHLGELLDRREHHVDVEQVGDQRARRQLAVPDLADGHPRTIAPASVDRAWTNGK